MEVLKPAAKGRVLVTRPEPGAGATGRRVEDLGFEPLVMPLSETVALAVPDTLFSRPPALVAATSPAALRLAPEALLANLRTVTLHAVGAATAEAARRAGFGRVVEGPGDAAGLAAAIAASSPGGPVLYLCGRVRTSGFEWLLAEAGIVVAALEVYDTVERRPEPQVLARLAEGPVTAALAHSTFVVPPLMALARDPLTRNALAPAAFCCLSPRIAAAFAPEFAPRLRVADRPAEAALLALLEPAGPSSGGRV